MSVQVRLYDQINTPLPFPFLSAFSPAFLTCRSRGATAWRCWTTPCRLRRTRRWCRELPGSKRTWWYGNAPVLRCPTEVSSIHVPDGRKVGRRCGRKRVEDTAGVGNENTDSGTARFYCSAVLTVAREEHTVPYRAVQCSTEQSGIVMNLVQDFTGPEVKKAYLKHIFDSWAV